MILSFKVLTLTSCYRLSSGVDKKELKLGLRIFEVDK